ncbi:dolichyl-phosphate beta-glucosyltransferase [Rhizoclosmatium sp. JEL0117]|nr:dolichyl-phosphate beta-glucosyltransferase [Rhizoclosmatium sp. JEL0117]
MFTPHPRRRTANERFFIDAVTNERTEFEIAALEPPRRTSQNVALSVVVPAFNEAARLPQMLNDTLDFLDARFKRDKGHSFEVIVVDDGSSDGTAEIAREIARKRACSQVRVLVLEKNRGKGGAVTQGMLVARGDMLLFADADGATRFSDIELLEKALDKVSVANHGIAVGSRAHMVRSDAVVKRSFIRNFLMHGFHTFLLLLGISSIKDTQCGFKLLTRRSAAEIFPRMHVEGWIFDIEMLLLATWHKIPIAEVPVTWNEVDGSKVNLLKDSVRMAIDLLLIRFYYFTGLWNAFKALDTQELEEKLKGSKRKSE